MTDSECTVQHLPLVMYACWSGKGLLGVGLELVAQLSLLELLGKALVVTPEQSNVRDVKQHHCQTL